MKKEVGASAGFLALLALLLHTQLPSPEKAPSGNHLGGVEAGKKDSEAEAKDQIEDVDGPWLATRAFFHAPHDPLRPKSNNPCKIKVADFLEELTSADAPRHAHDCDKTLIDLLGLPDPRPQMFSIVATVADPSHTHLALLLDQQTEAIERSVQASGWAFAGQWLPWVDRFDGNEPNIGNRRGQRWLQREQEELPGILVFRPAPGKGNGVLFVFLVPETVTGGINGAAFYAAMHLANVLSSGEKKIGLLAPTFSGSFPSLSDLLNTMKAKNNVPHISETVYGAVSSLDLASGFVNDTKSSFPDLNFHSGILNSKDYQAVFCRVLKKYGDLDDRVAVLKEDEGGVQTSINLKDCEKRFQAQTYYFPREISHLRNAYQEDSGAAKDPYLDQPGRINFTIRDPNSGEDSIPTFSETQTPLTQDTILSSITDELNRRHTHIVFISATNALDALFLVQALRAACPDTRVFVNGPNILFVSAAARQALSGTLFLSPYPMFFEGDDWLSSSRLRDRLMFPDYIVQGLYNVTQLLLTDISARFDPESLRGYSQPGRTAESGHYPGVWVLTLNRFGFLPIDLLPEMLSKVDGNKFEKDWFQHAEQKATTALPTVLNAPTAPRPWMLTVLVASIGIVLACFTFVRCNTRKGAKPNWLVFTDGYTSRFEALLCACLSLIALEWILASPLGLSRPAGPVLDWLRTAFFWLAILVGLAAPILTLLFAVYVSKDRIKKATINWRSRISVYYFTPIALFIAALVEWSYLCDRLDTGLFFRFRSLELYSGSSPALPLALVCFAFFCISSFHLKQYALTGLARPRLTIEQTEPASGYLEKFQDTYKAIGERMAAPWMLERSVVYRCVVAGVFVLFYFVILGLSSTNAFELQEYNWLLLAGIVTILLCLATKWYDLLTLWGCVKKLLDLILVLPLQPAVKRISKDWPKRSIWAFNRSVSKEAVQREMVYALHRRSLIRKQEESPKVRTAAAGAGGADTRTSGDGVSLSSAMAKQAEQDLNRFREQVFGKPQGMDKISARDELVRIKEHQSDSADLASRILIHDLIPEWRTSMNYDTDVVAEGSKTVADAPESLHQQYVENCADFVALQYCRYIAYAIAQVKRMATSISIIFVLLALIFNSYSPEGSQRVARFLVVLFLVIGYAIWRVFSQMERNTILSNVAHTQPGELSGEFWLQLLALGGLPLLGVLGHLFPAVSQFLFQWIAPSVQAAR